jgi:hypothetical protein
MPRLIFLLFFAFALLANCSRVPSSDAIEKDIALLDKEIEETTKTTQNYTGGLLSVLSNVRLETLKSTKAMLKQKNSGIRRYIPISYTVSGKEYTPPVNKQKMLLELEKDIKELKVDLAEAEAENEEYSSGLLGAISLTKVLSIKNSITFLEQKYFLLKHDIPFYFVIPDAQKTEETDFMPTPGADIDKF